VLVVLAAGVGMLNALLQQLFSAHPKLNDSGNLDFGHYLAVIVVAAAVGFYHWRVLRADAAARPPKAAVDAAPVPAAIAPAMPAPIHPAEVVEDHARHYALSVTDATEDDVHQALANLPPQASYRLTLAEKAPSALPTDGH
jgi:hypothetical protein